LTFPLDPGDDPAVIEHERIVGPLAQQFGTLIMDKAEHIFRRKNAN
jgi:hypothetical protein